MAEYSGIFQLGLGFFPSKAFWLLRFYRGTYRTGSFPPHTWSHWQNSSLPINRLIYSMSQQYQYSKEVDRATLARSRSFTTFPVRIHKNDARAQKASRQFVKEWKHVAGNKQFDVNVAQSPVGHFASLALPECLPERLAFAAKAFDYITAVDGTSPLVK